MCVRERCFFTENFSDRERERERERESMTMEKRLNNLLFLHINKDLTDNTDLRIVVDRVCLASLCSDSLVPVDENDSCLHCLFFEQFTFTLARDYFV